MTDQNRITPPQELLFKWHIFAPRQHDDEGSVLVPTSHLDHIATQAAQWGWDQRGAVNEAELQKARDEELEACCELVPGLTGYLRAARRPKPPSRKEQALEAISRLCASVIHDDLKDNAAIVRRALLALDD
jgi:hypothetical protein